MHNSHAIDNDGMLLSGCCASVRYAGTLPLLSHETNFYVQVGVPDRQCDIFADEDLSAHSSQRVPPCSAALPQQFELRIV